MDKKIYRILADLAKDSDKRNGESMQELADMLTAEGPNELKSLVSQWLDDHPELEAFDNQDAGEETMILNDHDADLLKKLMK